jgi:peptidyl-prolyl cis-trans isomerase B (cyclophilin B)
MPRQSALHRLTRALAATAVALLLAPAAGAVEAPRVKLVTTLGDVVIELAPDKAPASVENFLRYVNDGFYDGTVFHRVIDGFMIQGGGFGPNFQRKATRDPIPNEADNGLRNDRGTVAMARTNDPHSATAQFFINVKDNDFLNHRSPSPRGWGYAVFGRVVEGMDVVDRIKSVPTGNRGGYQDVPREDVVIRTATVVEAPQ